MEKTLILFSGPSYIFLIIAHIIMGPGTGSNVTAKFYFDNDIPFQLITFCSRTSCQAFKQHKGVFNDNQIISDFLKYNFCLTSNRLISYQFC